MSEVIEINPAVRLLREQMIKTPEKYDNLVWLVEMAEELTVWQILFMDAMMYTAMIVNGVTVDGIVEWTTQYLREVMSRGFANQSLSGPDEIMANATQRVFDQLQRVPGVLVDETVKQQARKN